MLISVCMTWSVQKGFLTNFFTHDNKVSMERKRDLTICVCMVKANFVVWQWGFGGETRGHHSHIVRCVCVCFCLFVCLLLQFYFLVRFCEICYSSWNGHCEEREVVGVGERSFNYFGIYYLSKISKLSYFIIEF